MILVINSHGDRLCKDGAWRYSAFFGTYRTHVKDYCSVARAKAALKRRGFPDYSGLRICQIPRGISVQANGLCIEQRLVSKDRVTYHHSKLQDYVVATI